MKSDTRLSFVLQANDVLRNIWALVVAGSRVMASRRLIIAFIREKLAEWSFQREKVVGKAQPNEPGGPAREPHLSGELCQRLRH